jgi:thiol:disulfide interchange protein DsbC
LRNAFATLVALCALAVIPPPAAHSFQKEAGPVKGCTECHTLTREEAAAALGQAGDNVVGVLPGPFPGLWEVDIASGGKIYPLYMDYSGKYLFNGQVLRMPDMANLTGARYQDLNRVDVSAISVQDAIVLGNRQANKGIIVLTDPTCPYCVKLHAEMKKAVAKDPEIAFYVMPYPRNRKDRATYEKCLAVVCAKTVELLDDAYSGKKLPPPSCKSTAVDDTMKLAERLGIQGTPSMVLPDGRIVGGYLPADALLDLFKK